MVEAIKKDIQNLMEFYISMLFTYDLARKTAIEDLRSAFDKLPSHISIALLKALKEAEELV